jgi:hypothetical protein
MVETLQYSILGYLVAGFIDVSRVTPENQNTMIPNALIERGLSFHGYVILLGTLFGMIPTVLDSLLVSLSYKDFQNFLRHSCLSLFIESN